MPETRRFQSIADIPRGQWNECSPNQLENYDYLLAIERSHIAGFTHHYYAINEGDQLLAAIPVFFTDYNLATTTYGWVRNSLHAIGRVIPMQLKLACLGSAETETCPIAMRPDLSDGRKRELFGRLLEFFDQCTKRERIHFLTLKDVSAQNKALYGDVLREHGFAIVPGLPTAVSDIDFASLGEYLDRLSPSTRKDMRRKLKKWHGIRIEFRRNIDDVLDEVYAMYLATRSRSDLQFDQLTPVYFREVLDIMADKAMCILYYSGDKLIGANLMLVDGERLLDKYFCVKSEEGRDCNLYFMSWFTNLQYCLDHGLRQYQSGQAGYGTKLRLKSNLCENWLYFRHRNPLINWLLRLASPLLAFQLPYSK